MRLLSLFLVGCLIAVTVCAGSPLDIAKQPIGVTIVQWMNERSAFADVPKKKVYDGKVLDSATGEGIAGVSITVGMNYRYRYVWYGGRVTYSSVRTTQKKAISGSGGTFSAEFHLDSGTTGDYSWNMVFHSWDAPRPNPPWVLESSSGTNLYVFKDADSNDIRDEYEAQLVRNFAPCLVLHSKDRGVSPEPVEIVGVDMTKPGAYLWARIWNAGGQCVDNPQLGGYEFRTNQNFSFSFFRGSDAIYPNGNYSKFPGHIAGGMRPPGKAYDWYALTLHPDWAGPSGNDPDAWYAAYEDERINNRHPDTIYCHLFKQGDEYVIQYWFFYPFNAFVNRHEGDWEHMNVVVDSQDPSDAEIVRVDYYFHHWVMARENPGVDFLVIDETHPLVFVGGHGSLYLTGEGTWRGEGSHGSYPMFGNWVDIGPSGPRLPSTDEYVDGQGRYIPYHKFDLIIIPNPDKIDYDSHPEMSWLKAKMQWGHLMVNSAGQTQLDWANFFSSLLFKIPEIFIDLPHDVGNLAPVGPAYNAGWNRTGSVGESYKTYGKTPPPMRPWVPPIRLENPGFEEDLDFWNTYGDGAVEATTQDAFNGSFSAHIKRDSATGHYSGLYQEDIVVEPDTEYRLSLWVKANSTSGYVAAGLGVWSADPSLNHHNDFGYVSGRSGWVHISGTWRSRPDENIIRVMLFGNPDFAGEAYFDDLILEEVPPRNGGFEKGLRYWEPYGDGNVYEAAEGGVEGLYCAHLARDGATGNYFGLLQRGIPCEPNTTYRLTLWVKTFADSGYVAAGLGNWGSPNTHQDFGYTGGYTDWTEISGTWTSRLDETSMDICLFGGTDFSGDLYFDGLALEKIGVAPLDVTILGPLGLGYKERGTYSADVSCGSGDYSYQWYKQYDGSDYWDPLGKGQSQGVSMLDRSFILKVEVRDAGTGAEGTATKLVEYEGNGDVKPVK